MIPHKPYKRQKHVESILGTCKNMTKKVCNLNDTIPHSTRLVNPYCIIDTKKCLITNNLFYCFKHHGLSYYNILFYQSYNKTLFYILCTVYNITINCHLRMLFINNLLYHSNIMIVYYNQCAFYCLTINCIKQKNPSQSFYCINLIMIQFIFISWMSMLRNQLTPFSMT